MRKFLSLCLVFALVVLTISPPALSAPRTTAPQTQGAADKLTNKDVAGMLNGGLSADVVIAKIKSSATNFDTSPAALQELKAAGVPDAVILAMVQAGAAASTAAPEQAAVATTTGGDARATIYVLRHKNFSSRNMQPSVYIDGDEVARIDDGKFFAIKLAPGKHTVEVNKGHSGAEIEMKAGEEYYFRVDYVTGFLKARSKIDFLQKEQGALEIKKMKPLEAKWIKDPRIVAVSETTPDVK